MNSKQEAGSLPVDPFDAPRPSGAPQRARGKLTSYADAFAIDLNAALLQQLPQALNTLAPVSMTQENLDVLGYEHGVYQLFHRGEPVYIGKSQNTLRERLSQHRRRCLGRHNIDIGDMKFRCLYVDKFVDAASPESVLIGQYRKQGKAPWNNSEGFAPKDVGRGRKDGKPGQWFIDRPVRHTSKVAVQGAGGTMSVLVALEALRRAVPFDLFRYASSRSGDPVDKASVVDYEGRVVVLELGEVSVMSHLRRIVAALPAGWQATVQPQGITIYRERVEYPYAIAGWRHEPDGITALEPGPSAPLMT